MTKNRYLCPLKRINYYGKENHRQQYTKAANG